MKLNYQETDYGFYPDSGGLWHGVWKGFTGIPDSGDLSMYGENWTNYDNEYTGSSSPGTSSEGGDESRPINYTTKYWKRIS